MKRILKLLPAILLLAPTAPAAGPVYQWTDAEGVTHFSEVPPVIAGPEVTRFELEPPPPASMADDYYSVINQARRMEQRRLQAADLRIRQLQAQAEADRARAAASAPAPEPEQSTPDVIYLPRWRPRHDWHDRPHHRPGPQPRQFPQAPGPWPIESLKPPGPRPYRIR